MSLRPLGPCLPECRPACSAHQTKLAAYESHQFRHVLQLEQDEGDDVPEAPAALPAWVQGTLQHSLD